MSTENKELPNNPSIKSETIRPFRKFCTTIMTIGSLPSSYQNAMSYQELLLWLCDYIENTVIPAFDNNANAIKELQNLYVELKSYVDSYFTNLDVQNEIDTKLDEMVSNGTFDNIINQKLFNNINNKIINNSQEIETLKQNNNNFVSKNEANSITMDMLTNEIKTAITGGSTPVVGENSINNFNIINNSIDYLNLNDVLKSNTAYNLKQINFNEQVKYPRKY